MGDEIDEIIAWCEAEAHPEREPSGESLNHLGLTPEERIAKIAYDLRMTIGCAMAYHDELLRICTEYSIIRSFLDERGLMQDVNGYLDEVKADLNRERITGQQ
jgi:hypothetical protein